MKEKESNTSKLFRYQKIFKDNPHSLVFAPLAEIYRKMGLVENALKILRVGLKNNPHYSSGKIVLGRCYFDEKNWQAAFDIFRPLVEEQKDNYSLLKIFALTCEKLGKIDQALTTFKILQFLSPKNLLFMEKIKELESINDLSESLIEASGEEDLVEGQAVVKAEEEKWGFFALEEEAEVF